MIIKFFAEWCGPCKALSPLVDKVFGSVTEVDIDTPEGAKIAEKYRIRGVPTLLRVDADGEVTNIKVGQQTLGSLEEWKDSFKAFS